MSEPSYKRVIFTGGPGSGKTSLINALAAQGYSTVAESGRAIIKQQVAIGGEGVPWQNPTLFAELMLSRDMQLFQLDNTIQPLSSYIFYDRAIADTVGYLMTIKQAVPAYFKQAIQQYRYHTQVFLFPPWQEIYSQDAQRKQTMAQAIDTYHAIAVVYQQQGYTLVEMPKTSIAQRMAFVLNALRYS